MNRHRANEGMATTHFQPRPLLGDALAVRHRQIGLPIGAIAVVLLRIDDVEIDFRTKAQAITFNALRKHRRTTDQRGLGQTFIEYHLHGAQHALFFAFGKDDALLR